MEEEKIMAIAEMQCSAYGDKVHNQNPIIIEGDDEQTTEIHSLLRLMKISNEFTTIKDGIMVDAVFTMGRQSCLSVYNTVCSMEIFPLPGNRVEPQHADILCFGPQARNFCQQFQATDLLTSLSLSEDTTKLKLKELAENAMDEVAKLFAEGEPLWQHDTDRGIEVLNYEEYVKRFSPNLDFTLDEIIRIIAVDAPLDIPLLHGRADDGVKEPKPESSNGYQASREIGYIQLPAICVVEILMDVRLWSFVFSEMLSRAAVLGILSPGAIGTYDGALQMMIAEYHAPSPLLQTRKSCFAKYCKEFSRNMWIIVDISLESMIDNPLLNCKRKPSGCLIQGLPDGNTQITWIEHTEAQVESIHPLFNSAVNSGIVFSAKHWVDTLARQCQNLNAMIQQSLSGLQREVSPFNRKGLLRIAQRMRREFHGALSATKDNKYKPLPFKKGGDILIRTIEGDAQSPAALITVTTSTRLPFVPKLVFGFLGDEKNRIKWDILALEHASQEIFHFRTSEGPEDIVSITKMLDEKGDIDTLFLQEKQENAVASYIVFSPITYATLISLSNQVNIDEIPLLPSGFAILSDENSSKQEESKGSILTLSFQLLDSSLKTQEVPKKTVRKLYKLVTDTISKIRVALFEPPPNANQDDVERCSW